MERLLSGNAPLCGMAGLELIVRPLDYRSAARFWGIDDPALAMKVNAILGGTPAYRWEFVGGDTPDGPDDFDSWVVRTVLNRAGPLLRESRYLLEDELGVNSTRTHHAILSAIADGNTARGGVGHYRTVLEDAGLVVPEHDAFRDNRTTFRIAEPLLTFYHAVMRPIWTDLEHSRDATELWRRNQHRFTGQVLGPHFERTCRYWTRHMAGPDLFGDYPNRVCAGTVNDPAAKTNHEVDVVVFGLTDDNQRPILAIGEVKWGETMGMGHLNRLRHIRGLLAAQGKLGAETAKLACYGGAGFTAELTAESKRNDDVVLVGLADLYS
ncbi:MAG TPA: hypothetical protein VG317_04810 [Pseudonocardiaceae bacterium]|nr:hypothetical protein [Pseudonocardiaceae bacterium]